MQNESVPAALWTDGLDEHEGQQVTLQVERSEPNEISIHTFIDGRGSMVSLYFDRESALTFLAKFADALVLR